MKVPGTGVALLFHRSRPLVDIEEGRELMATIGNVKVQFMPVGRSRREWMWKARDESNTITISGHRFDSLGEAVRDARTQIDGTPDLMSDDDDGPFVA